MASEEYPCAAVRRDRKTLSNTNDGTSADCLPARLMDAVRAGDRIAWLTADGEVLCGPRQWSGFGFTFDQRPRLIPFGRGLFVSGNGMYIRSVEDSAWESAQVTLEDATFRVYPAVADADGHYVSVTNVAAQSPTDPAPAEGDRYYNTTVGGLYEYADGAWQAMPYYYMALLMAEGDADELDRLRPGDRLQLTADGAQSWPEAAAVDTTGTTPVLYLRTKLAVSVAGKEMTVERKFPPMDFCVAHDNRIWGCRYGENADGDFVNEIYACALGDPTDWYQFSGTEDASFMASVGEPGAWTGAAVLNDNVVFFKEHCMLTVYGSSPASYSTQLTFCDGIRDGSDRSAVLIGGALYYHSPRGIMRLYSGSLPIQISDDISYKDVWHNAVGGTDGRKYYLRLTNADNESYLYVYDTVTGLWHVEDAEQWTVCMVPFHNELLDICSPWPEQPGETLPKWWVRCVYISAPDTRGDVFADLYLCAESGGSVIRPDEDTRIASRLTAENPLPWFFETGDFGHDAATYKRVKEIAVRAWLGTGAAFDIDIQYDEDGRWEPVVRSKTIRNGQSGTTRVDYRLRRCDLYRLRFRGTGPAVIYSITHTYETDGDRNYGNNPV